MMRSRFVLIHVIHSISDHAEEAFGLPPTEWSWILNSGNSGHVDAEPNLPNVRSPQRRSAFKALWPLSRERSSDKFERKHKNKRPQEP